MLTFIILSVAIFFSIVAVEAQTAGRRLTFAGFFKKSVVAIVGTVLYVLGWIFSGWLGIIAALVITGATVFLAIKKDFGSAAFTMDDWKELVPMLLIQLSAGHLLGIVLPSLFPAGGHWPLVIAISIAILATTAILSAYLVHNGKNGCGIIGIIASVIIVALIITCLIFSIGGKKVTTDATADTDAVASADAVEPLTIEDRLAALEGRVGLLESDFNEMKGLLTPVGNFYNSWLMYKAGDKSGNYIAEIGADYIFGLDTPEDALDEILTYMGHSGTSRKNAQLLAGYNVAFAHPVWTGTAEGTAEYQQDAANKLLIELEQSNQEFYNAYYDELEDVFANSNPEFVTIPKGTTIIVGYQTMVAEPEAPTLHNIVKTLDKDTHAIKLTVPVTVNPDKGSEKVENRAVYILANCCNPARIISGPSTTSAPPSTNNPADEKPPENKSEENNPQEDEPKDEPGGQNPDEGNGCKAEDVGESSVAPGSMGGYTENANNDAGHTGVGTNGTNPGSGAGVRTDRDGNPIGSGSTNNTSGNTGNTSTDNSSQTSSGNTTNSNNPDTSGKGIDISDEDF